MVVAALSRHRICHQEWTRLGRSTSSLNHFSIHQAACMTLHRVTVRFTVVGVAFADEISTGRANLKSLALSLSHQVRHE